MDHWKFAGCWYSLSEKRHTANALYLQHCWLGSNTFENWYWKRTYREIFSCLTIIRLQLMINKTKTSNNYSETFFLFFSSWKILNSILGFEQIFQQLKFRPLAYWTKTILFIVCLSNEEWYQESDWKSFFLNWLKFVCKKFIKHYLLRIDVLLLSI